MVPVRQEPQKHIPVSVIFHSGWWHKNYGIRFDRRYYDDPEHRVEINQRMERTLYERFGDLGMGNPDPPQRASVQNFWGCTIQQALLGCSVEFPEGEFPWAINLNLSDEQVMALSTPDVAHTYPVNEMLRQADFLEAKYGAPVMGRTWDDTWEGVQNVALSLRGNDLMLDYLTKPDLAQKLFQVVTETTIELNRIYDTRFGRPPFYTTGNCTVIMISPSMYRQHLLPYDNALSRALSDSDHGFGVHHCGVIDNYIQSYAMIENLQFIEAGWGSNLSLVRRILPSICLNARYGPVRIMNATVDQVRADISRLIREGSPLDSLSISVYGLDYGTPDENIRAMFHTVWEQGQL